MGKANSKAGNLYAFIKNEVAAAKRRGIKRKTVRFDESGKGMSSNEPIQFTDASITNKYEQLHTHRKGFVGRVARFIMTKIQTVVKVTLEKAFKTQERFNHEVIHNINAAYSKVDAESKKSKGAIDNLEKDIRRLNAKLDELSAQLRESGDEGLGEDFDYVSFEDMFRGSKEAIYEKQKSYVSHFKKVSGKVLDIGCGRGEFLSLLKEEKIPFVGVDLSQRMVDVCKEQGLEAHNMDAVEFLKDQKEESLGGVISLQVVEHLKPKYLLQLIKESYKKLENGGCFVAETVNPLSLEVYRSSYILDITHERLYHPETMKFLLTQAGFKNVRIEYKSMIADSERMKYIEGNDVFNKNMEILNAYIFNYLEYVAIAEK